MKRIFFKESDILPINKMSKEMTCRQVSQKNKYQIGDRLNCIAHHSAYPFATIRIVDIEEIEDITKQKAEFFKKLGYPSKKAYLSEDFNETEDKRRIAIHFEIVAMSVDAYCQYFRDKKYEKEWEAKKEREWQETLKKLEEIGLKPN